MKIIPSTIFTLCLFTVGKVFGQAPASPVAVSGFVDAYYSKNFNQPGSRINKLHNFDIAENQFTLSLVEIVLQKKSESVGFRIDADFGTTNDVVQLGSGSATLPFLQQAYLTAVLPIGDGLTVDAGKFVTHMGYEVIESKDNWNYGRSLLFAWAVPYYHTGIRLAYPVASNFIATIHVVNGWNSVTDNNNFKSLGLTLNYTPISSTNLILNVMDGVEQSDAAIAGKKKVFDFIALQQVTESFSLALNVDYGDERTFNGLAIWKGAAIYGRYTVNSKSAVALRGEIFDDPMGYATGTGTPTLDVKEITGTVEYKFADALLMRAEVRYDFSNASLFDNKTIVNSKNNQTTLLVGIVSSF
ncbi:MAG: porin [Bacteroidota bacterium]